MDDHHAFERQIAAEIEHEVGPPHVVDALAITRTAKTPSPRWRTQTMSSLAKVVTAGAIFLAIGGVMLRAQSFDQQGSTVPGAATSDTAMAPSFFSGTPGDDWVQQPGLTTRREDGVIVGTGENFTVTWDADDPRISGAATMVMNEADYRDRARTLAPTGDKGSIRTLLIRIANDGGTWEGPLQFLVIDDPVFSSASGWLTGTGVYDGLSAYVVWPDILEGGEFHGHITAEGPPPAPEGLPG